MAVVPEISNKVSVKKQKAKPKETAPKEEDLKYIYYFYRPQLVESLWKWELEEGDVVSEVRKPAS